MRILITAFIITLLLPHEARSQTNTVKIPLTGSSGSWNVILVGTTYTGNRVQNDTIVGTYDNPFWEFSIPSTGTGSYDLYTDSDADNVYVKATNFSGTSGRFMFGTLDIMRAIVLQETADPDNDGLVSALEDNSVNTSNIVNAAVTYDKLAQATKDSIASGSGFDYEITGNTIAVSVDSVTYTIASQGYSSAPKVVLQSTNGWGAYVANVTATLITVKPMPSGYGERYNFDLFISSND